MFDAYGVWLKLCLLHAFAMFIWLSLIWDYLALGPTPDDCDLHCIRGRLMFVIAHNDMKLVSGGLLLAQFLFLALAPCAYRKLEGIDDGHNVRKQ